MILSEKTPFETYSAGRVMVLSLLVLLVFTISQPGCGDDATARDDRCPPGQYQMPDGACVPGCTGDQVLGDDGLCRPCGPDEVARSNLCVCRPGYMRVDGSCVEVTQDSSVLSSDWHPDPDGDGIPTGEDRCPWVYDPDQTDADHDGTGDACDPDFSPPVENGPVTDLHAEHVTPYGAWLGFRSPRTETYGWSGYVAWSENPAELSSLAGIQQLVDGGDAVGFSTQATFGEPMESPVIIIRMEPDTTFHLALVREDWTGLVDEISNMIEIRTLPAPPIQLGPDRPRVLATPDLIQTLADRWTAQDQRMAAWVDLLGPRTILAGTDPDEVYNASHFCQIGALLYAVTSDSAYLDAASSLLDMLMEYWESEQLDGNSYRWANATLGACLDLVWNELSGATRERAVRAMLEDDEHNAFDDPPRWEDTDEFASVTRTQLVHGLVMCDAAGIPSDLADRGCAVLEEGLRHWYGVQKVKARRDRGFWAQSGGYLPDGSDYGHGTSSYWLVSFWVTHNVSDHIAEYAPWVEHNLFSQVIYALTPTRRGYYTQGDVEDFTYNYDLEPSSFQLEDGNASLMSVQAGLLEAAGHPGVGWARALIDELFDLDNGAGSFWRLLFDHDGQALTPHGDLLPTAFLDSGIGVLFDRSSWSREASALVFRAGWSGVDHSHQDLGHFQLFRAGRWITHEAIAYDGPAAQADGHNVLLLQQKDDDDEPDCVCQRTFRSEGEARIIRAGTGPSHTYALADLSGCYRSFYYHSDYYDSVQRALVWLKTEEGGAPDRLIVYDLIDTAQEAPPGAVRRWNLQIDQVPVISGRRATVELPTSAMDAGSFADQRLDVVVVLPETATMTHHGPQGSAGDYPGPLYNHRLVVDPGHDEAALRFLTVLQASDEPAPAPVADLIESEDWIGVAMDKEAVLFPRASQPWKPPASAVGSQITLPAMLPMTVWITGLAPDAGYDMSAEEAGGQVTLAIAPGSYLTADHSGLAAFTINAELYLDPVY